MAAPAGVKRIGATAANTQERFRLALSDGDYHVQGMLASQLNDLVRSSGVQNGSVVRVTDAIHNAVNNSRCGAPLVLRPAHAGAVPRLPRSAGGRRPSGVLSAWRDAQRRPIERTRLHAATH